MAGSMTIWLACERLKRFGIKITDEKLAKLKEKRKRQLKKLIVKYEKSPAIVARFEERFAYIS